MFSHKTIIVSLLLLATGFISPAANAVMIEGELSIIGTFMPTGGDTLSTATGIDFMDANGDYGNPDGAFIVGSRSGDFATYIPEGNFLNPTIGSIKDIYFASFSAIVPFWEIGGFSFDLLSLVVEVQTDDSLVLRGSGEIYGNNFDRTMGSWILTANGGQSTFTWSATTSSIPEAGSLLLFMLVLVPIIAVRVRRS